MGISHIFIRHPCVIHVIHVSGTHWVSGDTQVASTSWLLGIRLQWTWECYSLFQILISIFLDKYPEPGLLDHMVAPPFFFSEEPLYCFPKRLHHFSFLLTEHRGSNFPTHSHLNLSLGSEWQCLRSLARSALTTSSSVGAMVEGWAYRFLQASPICQLAPWMNAEIGQRGESMALQSMSKSVCQKKS